MLYDVITSYFGEHKHIFMMGESAAFSKCFTAQQAAVDKNIPIYKEAVKSNIVVKIDQERFLPAEM